MRLRWRSPQIAARAGRSARHAALFAYLQRHAMDGDRWARQGYQQGAPRLVVLPARFLRVAGDIIAYMHLWPPPRVRLSSG